MLDLETIYLRVEAWNAKRYDQEYDHTLAYNLLDEELNEFFAAKEFHEAIDALCDIVYVAMGAYWKRGHKTTERLIQAYDGGRANLELAAQQSDIHASIFIPHDVLVFKHIDAHPEELEDVLGRIIACCVRGLMEFDLTPVQVQQALTAVCDSNDSKKATKAKSSEKYGADGKGENYFPPTDVLKQIAREVRASD